MREGRRSKAAHIASSGVSRYAPEITGRESPVSRGLQARADNEYFPLHLRLLEWYLPSTQIQESRGTGPRTPRVSWSDAAPKSGPLVVLNASTAVAEHAVLAAEGTTVNLLQLRPPPESDPPIRPTVEIIA